MLPTFNALDLKRIEQKNSTWSYIACIQMVLGAFGHHRTQNSLYTVLKIRFGLDMDDFGDPEHIQFLLARNGVPAKVLAFSPLAPDAHQLPFEAIRRLVHQKQLIIAGDMNYVCVIHGYRIDEEGTPFLIVADPWYKQVPGKLISYQDFMETWSYTVIGIECPALSLQNPHALELNHELLNVG